MRDSYLHDEQFEDAWINGDWFNLTPELMQYILENTEPYKQAMGLE